MFYISKIMTAIIMPPGLILAVMILVLILFSKKRFSFYLLLFITLSLFLLSTKIISEQLIAPLENFALENRQNQDLDINADLIVVLGGGSVIQSSLDGTEHNSLSAVSLARVLEGIMIQKEKGLPILFTGGNVLKGEGAAPEAEGVRTVFKRLGLAESSYILESESRNTYENAINSAEKTSHRDIILVSSAFHLKRAALCFEAAGFNVKEFKAVDFRIDKKKINLIDFLPSMSALQNSTIALHEYWGLLYYKLYYF